MSWLTAHSYLGARILGGLLVLSLLAAIDLYRHGRHATRWREYAFLLFCVVVAITYGALNDQVSVTLSWEYFYYAKEQSAALGPDTPPAQLPLRLRAALVGMMATWSVGLLIGAALLIANNPWKRHGKPLPRLTYPQLATNLPIILTTAILCSALGTLLGYHGHLDFASPDFPEMRATNLWRPARFIAAWGEHLGAYMGGLVGLIAALGRVVWMRRKLNRAVAMNRPIV